MKTPNDNIRGVVFILLAMLILSLQNIAVKWINGGYPVMEIVIIRSFVAIPFTLLFFRLEGHRGLPTTTRPKLEYLRGVFLFLSYTTYFMGLAALPLAEVASIRYSAPLVITFLSVILLGEKVGLNRWFALAVGFMGVLFIVRPGSASFDMGSIFVVIGTLFYTFSVMVTRYLRTTDSSATMGYYSTLVYLVGAFIAAPLAILIGEMPDAHPSIAFLLHSWTMPTLLDIAVMCGLGLIWASGMYFSARAYSSALASVVAPFEYIMLPINVLWGFLFWQEIPTYATWIGAFLTVASGLYILYRERQVSKLKIIATPIVKTTNRQQ